MQLIKLGIALLFSSALFATAQAATIRVTTTADEFGSNYATCSLREAVQAANTNTPFGGCRAGWPGKDRIVLKAGLYILSRGTSGEDSNAQGDLDIVEDLIIEGPSVAEAAVEWSFLGGFGEGLVELSETVGKPKAVKPLAVIENGIGQASTVGDGDRVLHVDPSGSQGDVDLTLRWITIAEGDLSCDTSVDGANCEPGGAGIDQEGDGDITLVNAAVSRNLLTCFGEGCGALPGDLNDNSTSAAAIRSIGDGSLSLSNVMLVDNRAECDDTSCNAGHGGIYWGTDSDTTNDAELIKITHTIIDSNVSNCVANRCFSSEIVSLGADEIIIEDTWISRNRAECTSEGDPLSLPVNPDPDERCDATEVIATFADTGDAWRRVGLIANVLACEGNDCDTDEVMDGGTSGDSVMDYVDFIGNTLKCRGTGCDTDEVMDSFEAGGTLKFTNIRFIDNLQSCTSPFDGIDDPDFSGDRCDTDEVIDGPTGGVQGTIWKNVLVKGNRQICYGQACDTDEVVDSSIGGGGVNSWVEKLVVTENKRFCFGKDCDVDEILDSGSAVNYTFIDVEVSRNQSFCRGDGCTVDSTVDNITASGSLTIKGFVVADNTARCEGTPCSVSGIVERLQSPNADIRGFEVTGNRFTCLGAACGEDMDNPGETKIIEFGNLTGEVVDLVVEDNIIECLGTDCSDMGLSGISVNNSNLVVRHARVSNNRVPGDGAGFFNGGEEGPGTLEVISSQITQNRAGRDGGGFFNPAGGDLTLRFTEVKDNRADGNGGGILNQGSLTLFASPVTNNVPDNCVDSGVGSGC